MYAVWKLHQNSISWPHYSPQILFRTYILVLDDGLHNNGAAHITHETHGYRV